MSPTDRRAVVITGAGRGIGASIAELLAGTGQPLVLVYRSRAVEANATRERIGRKAPVVLVQADVSREEDILRVFETADREFGGVAGLVNNAASNGGRARLVELRREQLHASFETNVFGSFLCAREAARRMSVQRGGGGGAIVNISSGASKIGSPGVWVHYAASKAAVETMTIGLARELAEDGIRVNAVRCGVIDTEVHAGHGEDRLRTLMAQVPMKRMGKPAEVATAVQFLLSPQASYITGAVLDVAGGL